MQIPFRDKARKIGGKFLDTDFLNTLDRNIKTVGGVDIDIPGTEKGIKMLLFKVQDVYDLLAVIATILALIAILTIFTLITNGNIKMVVIISIGIFAIMVSRYTKPLGIFKENFEKELPGVIDTMVQGLSIGLPVETVLEYTAKTKGGIIQPFIKEIVYRLNTGESLESSLANVATKTLSPDFERVARVLALRSETTADLVKALEELLANIEIRQENSILAKAENAENTFFFPILVGYVVPYIVLVTYPLLINIMQFFSITK